MGNKNGRKSSITSIHIMALDAIVNANSLFTIAMFLGIVNASPTDPKYTFVGSSTTDVHPSCIASTSMAEDLIAFNMYSFSFYLFSSLVASALKQAIKINASSSDGDVNGSGEDGGNYDKIGSTCISSAVDVNKTFLLVGILASAASSLFGCIFLMLALVNLVQIKLGILACYNFYTISAAVPLLVFIPLALVLHIFIVLHALLS